MSLPRALGCYIFAGGFTLGVRRGGFEVSKHYEGPDIGLETAARNLKVEVKDFMPGRVKRYVRKNDVQMVFANPPCHGFASCNTTNQGVNHPDNHFMTDYWRAAIKSEAPVALFEMVPRWWTGGGALRNEILEAALQAGRSVYILRHSTGFYGAAQNRKRLFVIASRIHVPFTWKPIRPVTARGAIGDLATIPVPRAGYTQGHREYACAPHNHFQRMARQVDNGKVTQHYVPGGAHSPKLDPLIKYTYPGDRFKDLPPEIFVAAGYWPDDGQHHGKPSYVMRRMLPDVPCPVITGACRYVHYSKDRMLTLRESARIMGFPDWYQFTGTAKGYAEIGKGVDPYAASYVSNMVRLALKRNETTRGEVRLIDHAYALLKGYQKDPRIPGGRDGVLINRHDLGL